jgi:disulfide bond formation protein DsbB
MHTTQTAAAQNRVYTLLALAVLALAVIPVGAAVFVLGFVQGDSPCVMCWEQRIGMALVALVGLFVLRFGARPKYIGLSVLVGAWGVVMGLRHVGMHAARDIGQGFSAEILGAHTYTWSLFIFWVCIATMGVLLMLREGERDDSPRALRPLEKLTMVVFLIVIAGNIVQAFASTGPPPYMGQGDPVRFSFNPKHWVWSTEEWTNVLSFDRWSLRGRWAAEKPTMASATADPAGGPLANLPVLGVKEQRQLALPLKGSVSDLSYDAATDRFLATTEHGVYILDGGLQHVLRYTVVDPGYSVDLGNFAGAAFLDGKDVMALGENKSYVVLREDDKADADGNFRYFLESFDRFSEVRRSRFGTVRARMMFTMSLAFDPASRSLYTVTVPNSKSKGMVVSRFDRRDLTLSEEFTPVLKPGAGPVLAGKRSLDEYYVTAATIENGRMYALSAAFSTLLTIDLATRQVVAAYAIPGLDRPTGVAVKGDSFYIVCQDGRVVTVTKP